MSKRVRRLGPPGSRCQSQVRNWKGLLGWKVMKGRGEEAGAARESPGPSADLNVSSELRSRLPVGGAPSWGGKARPDSLADFSRRLGLRSKAEVEAEGAGAGGCPFPAPLPVAGWGLCPAPRRKRHPSLVSPHRPGPTLMFWFALRFTELGVRSLGEQGPCVFLLCCRPC